MNVSEQLLEMLENEGVRHILGVAGDALNPLVSAIGNKDGAIAWVPFKHEGNASYAAFAQGEVSANLGVCASTVGPGALHLVNGLYNAKKERSPVLAITGQVPLKYIGTNYHQEVDLKKIFDDICRYQAVVRSPEEAPRVMARAIRTAINQRCVCRIELPADVAQQEAVDLKLTGPVFRSDSTLMPSQTSLQKAAWLIQKAKSIGILAGAGCREAREEVLSLARKLKAPITHTLRSCDIFDHATDPVVGLTGLIGNPSGYRAVMECDLLLMLGTDFPYDHFLPRSSQVIQLDCRAENIGNRIPVDVGLHGQAKPTLQALGDLCLPKEDSAFMDRCREEFLQWKDQIAKECEKDTGDDMLHPQLITREIDRLAASDAIFTIDTGTSSIWTSNYMTFGDERRVLGAFNHGSMAVALPAAIGAQLSEPERQVWAFLGDGAFHMSLHDLSTAVENNLPIKFVVFANSQLGFVKIEMEEAGLAPNLEALRVNNFNFAEYAKLVGGDGMRVESPQQLSQAVTAAVDSDKPYVIEAMISSGELAMPPRLEMDQVTHFGLSKAKELFRALKGDRGQWNNIKEELESLFGA